jgi:alpha-L-fucosidase
MKVNGEAIYASRSVAPYRDGKFRYTRLKDGTVYAFYLPDAKEAKLPATLRIPGPAPAAGSEVKLLGNDASLKWRREGEVTVIEVPAAVRKQTANAYAWAVRLPGAVAGN